MYVVTSYFSLGETLAYARSHRNKTFILKPDIGCRGRGIFLTKNLKDIKPFERMICQVYISKVSCNQIRYYVSEWFISQINGDSLQLKLEPLLTNMKEIKGVGLDDHNFDV